MPDPTLAPCPFCGSADVAVEQVWGETLTWSGFCRTCDATGPRAETETHAVQRWNERANS